MRSDHVYLKDSCIVHQPNYAAVLHRLVDSWRMDVRKEISGKNGSIFKLVFGAFTTAAHRRELSTRICGARCNRSPSVCEIVYLKGDRQSVVTLFVVCRAD